MAFDNEGEYLCSGGSDGLIKQFHCSDYELQCTSKGHEEGVVILIYAPSNKYLVSGCEKGIVRVWDHPTMAPIAVLPMLSGAQQIVSIEFFTNSETEEVSLAMVGLTPDIFFVKEADFRTSSIPSAFI